MESTGRGVLDTPHGFCERLDGTPDGQILLHNDGRQILKPVLRLHEFLDPRR
jgi:hypothetical protein